MDNISNEYKCINVGIDVHKRLLNVEELLWVEMNLLWKD
jgi:hypothetical protein